MKIICAQSFMCFQRHLALPTSIFLFLCRIPFQIILSIHLTPDREFYTFQAIYWFQAIQHNSIHIIIILCHTQICIRHCYICRCFRCKLSYSRHIININMNIICSHCIFMILYIYIHIIITIIVHLCCIPLQIILSVLFTPNRNNNIFNTFFTT